MQNLSLLSVDEEKLPPRAATPAGVSFGGSRVRPAAHPWQRSSMRPQGLHILPHERVQRLTRMAASRFGAQPVRATLLRGPLMKSPVFKASSTSWDRPRDAVLGSERHPAPRARRYQRI